MGKQPEVMLDVEQSTMQKRILWVMVARLALVSVSLMLGAALFDVKVVRFYHFIGIYYSISLLYIVFVQRTVHHTFLGVFQIAVDLAAITSIVMATDPVHGIFGTLYLVAILLANMLFPRYGSIIAAVVSSILFAGTVLMGFQIGRYTQERDASNAVYVTYIYLVVLLGTGYLSFYVGRLLQQKNEELARLRQQSEYVFHNIGTGMLMVDGTGGVRYANPAASRMLGGIDATGSPRWQHLLGISGADGERVMRHLEQASEVELDVPQREGPAIPAAVTLSPVAAASGKSRFNILLLRDLREQREHENRIRDTNRLSGIVDLSAMIAHEIRNPLASLSGSAELLLERLGDAASRRLAHTIVSEVERVDTIVEDFLSFARLRATETVPTDLNELMTDIAALLYHSRRFRKGTKIIFHEQHDPVTAMVDPRQIKQALLNLGINAIDAMPNGGELELGLAKDPQSGMVEITVSDTGDGIAPNVLARIFDPFFSTKESGTGIGLYVAKCMVESHRGTINVESSPGAGSTFRIRIPSTHEDPHDA